MLILAWHLSPTDFGSYSVMMVSASLVSMFGYRWLSDAIVRFCAEKSGSSGYPLVGVILWAFLTAGFVVVAYCVTKMGVTSTLAWPIVALGAGMGWELYWTELLRAQGYSKPFAGLAIGASVSRLVWVFVATVYLRLQVHTLIHGYVSIHIVAGCLAAMFGDRQTFKSSTWSWDRVGALLGFGLPLVGTKASNYILAVGDRFLITWFRGEYEVGLYSSLYQLGENSVKILGSSLVMSSAPMMFRAWSRGDKRQAVAFFESALGLFFIATLPVVGILVGFSKEIVGVLLPEAYSSSAAALAWIGVGGFFLVLSTFGNRIWELNMGTRTLMLISFVPVVVNVGLNIWLIPLFGLLAAAINTAITYIVYSACVLYLARRLLKWTWPWRDLALAATNTFFSLLLGRLFFWVFGYLGISLAKTASVSGLLLVALVYVSISLIGPLKQEKLAVFAEKFLSRSRSAVSNHS
jgi:O-antigen/teichoic acid export membrane protein